MQLKDARTISPQELLDRRKQTLILCRQGMKRTAIAQVVGVHRNTVGQWIAKWKEGGTKALKAKASGRPVGSGRRLTPEQEKRIQKAIVDRNPEQLKLDFALWTRDAVRLLILQDYGLDMPIRTVGLHAPKARSPSLRTVRGQRAPLAGRGVPRHRRKGPSRRG